MGGANLSLFELACEMKKKGVKVYVAVLYRGCPIDIRLEVQELRLSHVYLDGGSSLQIGICCIRVLSVFFTRYNFLL